MTANGSDRAEFEGQIFAIPGWLQGRRGQCAEWLLRVVGVALLAAAYWLIFSGLLIRTPRLVYILVGAGACATLTLSWNVRCWRFGWRFRYIGTFQYFDARDRRARLTTPAPDVPADLHDARTSFLLRPVRRLDGSRTW